LQKIGDIIMELKKFTFEECQEFTGATGLLGKVVAVCSHLYEQATSQEQRDAIVEFQRAYAGWRNRINIEQKESIKSVYKEVAPLVTGNNPLLDIDYILMHTRHAIAV
jgi:hypothetical protein